MTVFLLKEIEFFNRCVRVILQNANGPCPLIAVSNVMILENRLHLPTAVVAAGFIEDSVLIQHVANLIMDSKNEEGSAHAIVHEVIEKLPSTLHGIDLNIRFESADLFEFTPAISFFDVLGVKLYHGWCADPSRIEEYQVLSKLSYNEAMTKLVTVEATESEKEKDKGVGDIQVNEAALVRFFLENDGVGQLTFQGLVELLAKVSERSLSVLYRNNHFSTLFKYNGALYILVTDSGYADHHGVVWETLNYDSISGDSTFCPAFTTTHASAAAPTIPEEVVAIESDGALPIVFDLKNNDNGGGTSGGGNSRSARFFTRRTPEKNQDCSSSRPSCVIM